MPEKMLLPTSRLIPEFDAIVPAIQKIDSSVLFSITQNYDPNSLRDFCNMYKNLNYSGTSRRAVIEFFVTEFFKRNFSNPGELEFIAGTPEETVEFGTHSVKFSNAGYSLSVRDLATGETNHLNGLVCINGPPCQIIIYGYPKPEEKKHEIDSNVKKAISTARNLMDTMGKKDYFLSYMLIFPFDFFKISGLGQEQRTRYEFVLRDTSNDTTNLYLVLESESEEIVELGKKVERELGLEHMVD